MAVKIFWAITHLYFVEYPESNKFRWRNEDIPIQAPLQYQPQQPAIDYGNESQSRVDRPQMFEECRGYWL